MSQPNTSDLVSTIATQLNIVIVALRLLAEMIQNPDATSPKSITPGTCPSRPPASPASPLFRTTTAPTISWAPCDQPDLAMVLQKTPTPMSTSTAGKRTPPAHHSSPTLGPLPSPTTPPSSPLPSPSLPVADEIAPSSPAPLSLPPSPVLSPPGFAYSPPSPLPPPPHSPSPSCSLVSSAPRGPLPPRPRKRRSPSSSPSPCPSPRPHSDTSWDDDWSTKDDDLLVTLKCNERLRPSWRYITTKMQRPESQIRARWAELLDLQRPATS